MNCENPFIIRLDDVEPIQIYPFSYLSFLLKTKLFEISKYCFVPCGKCFGCQRDKARTWSHRIKLESFSCKKPNNNLFVTLTYSNENLTTIFDPEQSKYFDTLNKNDVTKFLDNLRKTYKRYYNISPMRFFLCGEYGSNTKRPHYHLILFNSPLELHLETPGNFSNLFISKFWNLGHSQINLADDPSFSYVAGYVTKKYGCCHSHFIEPPFFRFSRRLGIEEAFKLNSINKMLIGEVVPLSQSINLASNRVFKYYLTESQKEYLKALSKDKTLFDNLKYIYQNKLKNINAKLKLENSKLKDLF